MPVYVTARFAVRPEGMQASKEAIEKFVSYIKENEPGTRLYTSLQDEQDPTQFLHLMIFEDEAADEVHRGSEAVKQVTDVLYSETIGGTEFKRFTELAST